MSVFESIISAIRNVLANKLRSFLTVLGIVIGITAVIMVTAIGSGFQNSTMETLGRLGVNSIEITNKSDESLQDRDLLRIKDYEIIKAHPNVKNLAPMWSSSGMVKLRLPGETEDCYVIGSNSEYRAIQVVDLVYGRFIIENDVENKSKVAVIDEALAEKAFGRTNCLGETIHVTFWFGTLELTVVGITKSETYNVLFNIPSMIFLPHTTIMSAYNTDYVGVYYATVNDPETMDRTALEIARLLEISHGSEGKYNVQNLMKQMETINDVLSGITAFVALVAFISFLVGGIGIMNIMLVTVTERTREIGIRKSLGATNTNIMAQFLIEAVILTFIGGVIGVLLGYAGGFALGGVIDTTPQFSMPVVLLAVFASSLFGIIFGVFPAYKAARLDPIEALRYE
ncbi:MAG: ABC transporter permease [Clostridiales bacterium]|nr:ABC transporter permease [Clostridiales bacterium]